MTADRNKTGGGVTASTATGGYAVLRSPGGTSRGRPLSALLSVKPALAIFLLLAGCGAARPAPPRTVLLEETRIVAHQQGDEVTVDSYDASQLFARAYELSQAGRCDEAVELYDRLVAEFPGSHRVSPALYNAALCLARAHELALAADHYATLLERAPHGPDAKHAGLQMTEVLVELERWPEALDAAETLLDREDLRSDERLEAMARRAQALLGAERLDEAQRAARDALTYYRTRRADEVIADEYFAAAANFVLAETVRLRSEAVALPDADVARQHEALDRRARLLLDAQAAYFDTIRLTDARWAAAAGYRIGAMYEGFYRAITTAPVPPPPRPLAPAAVQIYERSYREQLAERVRPLVRHAIRYWELTLLMVERTGVEPVERGWVDQTRADLSRARRVLLGAQVASSPGRALGSPAGQDSIVQ